jgi:nucleobase:cation symporter-1, NCS1 family
MAVEHLSEDLKRLTTDLTSEDSEAWELGTVEQRGIEQIPEADRRLTPRGLAGLWAGGQWQVTYLVFGLLVASLGLSLWQAIAVILVGNLSYAVTGLASLQGPRTGTTTFGTSRAAFGWNANRVIGLFNWLTMVGYEVLNIYIIVSLAAELLDLGNITHLNFGVQLLMVVIAAAIQLILPILGHATITRFLGWIVWPFILLFAVMSVLVLKDTNFPTHTASFGLWTVALSIVISAGGLGWSTEANDFSRYLPRRTSSRATILSVIVGAAIPSVLIELLGACAFYTSRGAFDVVGVSTSFSDWFKIPFLIFAMAQIWCTGALTVYSSGVTVQAIGLPIRRWIATLMDGIIGTCLAVAALASAHFYSDLAGFVLYAIVWAAPWVSIFLVDWYLRRGRYVSKDLVANQRGLYWHNGGFHWPAVVAQALGMGAALMWLDGSAAFPKFTGPLAKSAFGGSDLSWLMGAAVAGVVYLGLAHGSVRREAANQSSLVDPAQPQRHQVPA